MAQSSHQIMVLRFSYTYCFTSPPSHPIDGGFGGEDDGEVVGVGQGAVEGFLFFVAGECGGRAV